MGLHLVGADGTILQANRTELKLLGYAKEEFLGHHIAEFHADPAVIDDILRRLAAGEELRDYEARMRCKDGASKYVMINANGLWENGEFIQARCFTRDITSSKQAEEAQGRLAAIVESSHDAIISSARWPDRFLEPRSRAAVRLFRGGSDRPAITILIPKDRLGEEETIIARLRRGERIEEHETVRLSKQGERLQVSLSVSPVPRCLGPGRGRVEDSADISVRRRTELAIRRSEATTRFLATPARRSPS